MVDGSRALDENDKEIMELIRGRKAVVLLNKTDLETVIAKELLQENDRQDGDSRFSKRGDRVLTNWKKTIQNLFYQGSIDFNDEVLDHQCTP